MFTANKKDFIASKLRTKIIALEPSILLELDRALSCDNFNQSTGLAIARRYATLASESNNQNVMRIMRGGMLQSMKNDAKTIHQMDCFKS